jgi:hypothetical protein
LLCVQGRPRTRAGDQPLFFFHGGPNINFFFFSFFFFSDLGGWGDHGHHQSPHPNPSLFVLLLFGFSFRLDHTYNQQWRMEPDMIESTITPILTRHVTLLSFSYQILTGLFSATTRIVGDIHAWL